LQVISDEGVVFGTSVNFVNGLLSGRSPSGFVLLTRLPFKVAANRYKPSPTWNPASGEKEMDVDESELSTTNDAQSVKVVEQSKQKKSFVDKKVW
jgi:hypothetical protein